MVQDDVQQGPDTDEPEMRTERRRPLLWQAILLLLVVLIVLLLLWLYLRQPQQSPLTAVNRPIETTEDTSADRPEPTVPDTIITPPSESSRVPDVVGDPRSAAETAVKGAGYAVSSSTVYSASKASGIVVAQSPSGGTMLDAGETVAIVVSVGTPESKSVTMPKIVGLTQASAESKVTAAGLVPYITYGDVNIEEGRVISQWPAAGESIPAGSEGFIQVQLNN